MRLRSGSQPQPNAGGTLADVPLPSALLYIRNKKLSGVLDLRVPGSGGESTSGRHGWVVLWRGRVVTATTTPPVARFGAVAYELGFIDGETLDRTTLLSEKEQRPHAEILVESGALEPLQIRQTLEEQTCRRVHHMFSFPNETTFLFREGRPSSMEPQQTIDLLAPVWRGLSDYPPFERIDRVLTAIGDRPVRIANELKSGTSGSSGNALGNALDRAGLSPAEADLCEALTRGPMTVAELRATSRLNPDRVDLLVYLLVLARCAEPEGLDHPIAPSSAMWTAVKARIVPTVSGTLTTSSGVRGPRELGLEGIRTRAACLDGETAHQTLGLEEDASAEAVRAAYIRLAGQWNPEKLPSELEPVRDQVRQIFSRLQTAYAQLSGNGNRTAKR